MTVTDVELAAARRAVHELIERADAATDTADLAERDRALVVKRLAVPVRNAIDLWIVARSDRAALRATASS